jgi:hypothetical protein
MTPAAPIRALGGAALLLAGCTGGGPVGQGAAPPGAPESSKTDALEAGAALLQNNGPLAKLDMYLVGFHPMKQHPEHQMEAHHFCRQVNEDFAQCALFDGNTAQANLNGIEYIISEKLFEGLPAAERRYWHPHNAEILSGQLVAPGLPKAADKALMRSKINSYGKTWHTWHSRDGVRPGDALPMGPAMLAWSFNRDGEARPDMVQARDRRMEISSAQLRAERQDLAVLARPQEGVDALRAHFPEARPIPGVVDKAAAAKSAETADPSVRDPAPPEPRR